MASPYELNLRHLRGLLAIQELGSVSAAAAALSLSQPALTQGLVKLEMLLGHVLFERRPDGMLITGSGELLVARVRAAVTHLRTAIRQLGVEAHEPERRLSMTQLRALLALVQTGSFAAAAIQAESSQTAMHRAVRDLENVVQKKLVERRGRSVHVNFAGRRFARSVRLAVHEIEAAFSELGIDPGNPIIALGTTPLTRAFLTPEAMAMMVAEKFPAGFQVSEGSWGELVELLRDGAIDLIVGELSDFESPDLAKTALYDESLVIVAGKQHPLVGKRPPSLAELARYPWIVSPDVSPLRAEWERLFPVDMRPNAPIECGSIMIIGRLLTSSDLLTLATPDQVALQIRSGLLSRVGQPLTERNYTVGITMRQSWRPTVAQRRFIQALREVASAGRQNTHVSADWV